MTIKEANEAASSMRIREAARLATRQNKREEVENVEQYMVDAIERVKVIAEYTKRDLEELGDELAIESDWIVDVFRKEFSKAAKSE